MADDDDVTSPGGPHPIAHEIEAVAAVLRALWLELKIAEDRMNKLSAQATSGGEIDRVIVAAQWRGLGDCLSDRSVRLHDAARRMLPRGTPRRGTKH